MEAKKVGRSLSNSAVGTLSGYRCRLIDRLSGDWRRVDAYTRLCNWCKGERNRRRITQIQTAANNRKVFWDNGHERTPFFGKAGQMREAFIGRTASCSMNFIAPDIAQIQTS